MSHTTVPLPDPTDTAALERAFAATYDNGVRILGDYQTVQEYGTVKGWSVRRTARAVGIDESTAESWLAKGSQPAPKRGLDRLRERGWLDLAWEEPPLTGLAALTTWIFIRGRVTEWKPLFRVAGDASERRLAAAATAAGIETMQPTQTHSPQERTPDRDTWLLGRLLVALDTPRGGSTDTESLPGWLLVAPEPTRRRIAQLYVSETAFPAPDGDGLAIAESRPDPYANDLIALLDSVTDGDVWGPGWPVRLRGQAVEDLQRDPAY